MSVIRITGMVSGLDTDQIVRDLMRVERMKVDKLYQQRQTLQWQKEAYREVINKIRVFRDTYFDVLNPKTNLTSTTALKQMTVTSSHPEIVTVTAGPDAVQGTSTFRVIQSATAAKAQAAAVTAGSETGSRLSLADTLEAISGKLTAGPIVFDENGEVTVTINGTELTFSKDDTLRNVLAKITNSGAGVLASYSEFSDTLTLTARTTGEGRITISGQFWEAFGFAPDAEGAVGESGRNAEFEIDGFRGSRPENTFTIDGKTYTINKEVNPGDESPVVTLNTAVDTEAVYNVIVSFVNDYNKLIEYINGKLNEEYFRDFQPLTDEQKEAMTEKEIELWEEKAKSGLLRRDSSLTKMLQDLRQVLYSAVDGLNLTQFGIETSRNWRDHGKLVLRNNGADLKAAIAANPDKVADFFTKRSSISYSATITAEERAQRYAESGLASRISDILNDYIRTTRDSSGRKGILLEKAGIEGDVTEFQNSFDKRIAELNKQIARMNEMLLNKENEYYRQFALLETALQSLYAQSSWLAGMLQSQSY
ncbi:MAG: flagellar filament capping protein FliD [Firmicutes bacterium]|nr:flagellar filament capping protein FliD [Bacillota bacterium]